MVPTISRKLKQSVAARQSREVIGESKPAREGQMKTGHFESGIAHGAAWAAQVRDEPTRREPATFHRHFGGQRLVGAQNRS